MSNIVEKIDRLREENNKNKMEIANLEGQISSNLKRLKDDFNLNSIEEAEIFLNSEKVSILEEEKKIENSINALEEELHG